MKRNSYIFLVTILVFFSFTSCKVSKQYVTFILKKAEIETPETKKVILIATDDIKVLEFSNTFQKNYEEKAAFSSQYLNDFSKKNKGKQGFWRRHIRHFKGDVCFFKYCRCRLCHSLFELRNYKQI